MKIYLCSFLIQLDWNGNAKFGGRITAEYSTNAVYGYVHQELKREFPNAVKIDVLVNEIQVDNIKSWAEMYGII